jgi:hypothetical protein
VNTLQQALIDTPSYGEGDVVWYRAIDKQTPEQLAVVVKQTDSDAQPADPEVGIRASVWYLYQLRLEDGSYIEVDNDEVRFSEWKQKYSAALLDGPHYSTAVTRRHEHG